MIFETTAKEKLEVYAIAGEMKKDTSLSPDFIAAAVEIALRSQGAYDLMTLWRDETDVKEREEIIADLQESIDDFKVVVGPQKKPKLSFENFEETIKDIKKFKKRLRDLVDQRGGIVHLSKLTGIPQPSLSRLFSSASMPRKTTLYKIAVALDLEEKDIVTEWTQ